MFLRVFCPYHQSALCTSKAVTMKWFSTIFLWGFLKLYLNPRNIRVLEFISNLLCIQIPTTYPLEGIFSTLITLFPKGCWNTIFMVWALVSDHIFTLDPPFTKSACETVFVQGLALSWSEFRRMWI